MDPNTNDAKTEAQETSPAVAVAETPDVTAESSPATPPTGDMSAEEIVKTVLAKREAESPTAKQAEKPEEQEDEKEPVQEAPEAEEQEEEKPVPFHNHPRWKKVLAERDEAKAELEKAKAEVEGTQVLVAQAKSLQEFREKHQLNDADVGTALELAALSRSNPAQFAAKLEMLVDAVRVQMGQKLPGDLQTRVEEGRLDEQSARELAMVRMAKAKAEEEARSFQEEVSRQRVQAISTALNQWESVKATSDAGFSARKGLVYDRFIAMAAGKPNLGVQEAVELATRADQEVTKWLSQNTPRPKAAAPKKMPVNGSGPRKEVETLAINDWSDLTKIVQGYAARRK